MGKKLDKVATDAVTAPGFEDGKSMCQRFARQCVEKVHGKKYESLIHKPSAREAGEAFRSDGRYVIPKEQGSVPGDLLYKLSGSGGFGHVGVRVSHPPNSVAENSVTHFNHTGGKTGRGFRSLEDFGSYDVIVRLPETE